jgi:hypothetical protein
MVTPKKKQQKLPFRRNFLFGILLVFVGKVLALQLGLPWILYGGLFIGGVVCVIDVFRALKQMR